MPDTKVDPLSQAAGSAVEFVTFGTHIKFVLGPSKPKTLTWWVLNKYDGRQLGWIGWYPPWRKYSFFVKPYTVYEQVCLREIANFCEQETKAHKQKPPKGPPS